MKHPEKQPDESKEEFCYLKPCSAQDCTGLIPKGLSDEAELQNYEELYPFLPKVPGGSKCRNEESAK